MLHEQLCGYDFIINSASKGCLPPAASCQREAAVASHAKDDFAGWWRVSEGGNAWYFVELHFKNSVIEDKRNLNALGD
eukprot:scaffold4042_cov40-Prasinocladus_malaysianus.AAC.4